VYYNDTLAPHWDILEQSHVATGDLQTTITWQTLMDFKDKHDPAKHLPEFKLAQKIADSKACTKEFLKHTYLRLDFSPFVPASSCMAISTTGTIHGNYSNAYREATLVPMLKQYLQSKHNWDLPTLNHINWQWFQKSTTLYRHASKNHLTKLVYNQLPTPARLLKQCGKHWSQPTCPQCNNDQLETFDHMISPRD
jgi:hypothetical protein